METTYLALANLIAHFAMKNTDRLKEETLTYCELLRYMSSLTRLNARMVDAEIRRLDDLDYSGRIDGQRANTT